MIVYLLRNAINGKCYVGATKQSLSKRWTDHVTDSKRYSSPLYRAFAEHGTQVFEKRVLNVVLNEDAMYALESFWIRELRAESPVGYNGRSGGQKGFTVTPEGCARMSARMRGTKMWVGKKHSPETIEKLIRVHTGVKASPETRASMSASQKRRWVERKANAR